MKQLKHRSGAWWRVRVAGAATVLISLQTIEASAVEYSVGAGGGAAGCTFSSLADALAFADGDGVDDVIRLATNTVYDDDVIINGTDKLTITGGWSSCTDQSASGRTLIVGNGAVTAPLPTLLSSASDLTLRDLAFSAVAVGGTRNIVLLFSGGSAALENLRVHSGTTGVVATNNAWVSIDAQTRVVLNTGTSPTTGGGVNCSGGSTVEIHGVIADNSAIEEGGGLRAEGGCFVQLFPGAAIAGNSAVRGGGVYLEGGAFLGGGGSTTPAVVADNSADEGGGFYVAGAGSLASIFNTQVVSNEARFVGGGVVATNGGEFSMNRSTIVPCQALCSQLSYNSLTLVGAEYGSAAFAGSGGKVTLHQTFVEHNTSATSSGRLLHAEDPGSELTLEAVQIWNNKASWLISAPGTATARAAFISAARNEWWAGGSTYLDSHGADGGAGSGVRFFNSILTDIEGGFAGTVTSDCGIFDELTGLDSNHQTVIDDPKFVSASSGDLHLRPDSPAIDYCDTTAFTPTRRDLDLDLRGYDMPGAGSPGGAALIDLGVDEAVGLFWDGFESGDTSAWSDVLP